MRSPKQYLQRRRRKFIERWTPLLNRLRLVKQWHTRSASRTVARPRPLIVSLTSYPARFDMLHLTLKSLLCQTVRADRVILWIATGDANTLPRNVLCLQEAGLEIRHCEDWRSYKKIIPALFAFPESDIVTADDDVYYWPTWLAELLSTSDIHPNDVIAHRVHRITMANREIKSYREWELSLNDPCPNPLNFATGIGGVLYPNGCFHSDVTRVDDFLHYCPTADDVWLYWMVRRNGRLERHSGTLETPRPWNGSQDSALWKINKRANDEQIRSMIKAYGLPCLSGVTL